MEKTLYCGASRMKITPPMILIPNLRGLMDKSFGGILDELYVRVIAFSDGDNKSLVISFDLDKAPNPKQSFERIFERTGVPEANILFFAIHTHCAPITGYRPFEKPNDITKKPVEVQEATNKYEAFIMEVLLKTVDEAIEKMQPAKMGYGYGNSYININRNEDYYFTDENGDEKVFCGIGNNAEAPVDHTVFVIKIEDLNGKPIAFLVNYAVHNVAMIWNQCGEDGKVLISSDIGGNVSRYMEERFEDSVAIWSSGAAADINPIMMNEVFYPDPMTGCSVSKILGGGDAPIVLLNVLAARHFADVMKIIKNIDYTIAETSISGVIDWSKTPGQNEDGQEDNEPYTVRLHLVRIGNIALYGIGGELYSSLGKRVKEISPMKNTVIINHDASLLVNCGYIYDDAAFEHNERTLGEIVGMSHTKMLPGYFKESMEKCTLDMFSKIM